MAHLPELLDAGDGLVLRRWSVGDAAALDALIADNLEHLRPYMPWIGEEPKTLAQRAELIATWDGEWRAGQTVVFGMWLDGELAGSCGLHDRIGPTGREIGYWVGRRHLGRSLAARSSALLTSGAFAADPSIAVVEIHHDESNWRSRRVPEQLGYTEVGVIELTRDLAPAETGREHVWRVTRDEWAALGR